MTITEAIASMTLKEAAADYAHERAKLIEAHDARIRAAALLRQYELAVEDAQSSVRKALSMLEQIAEDPANYR